MNKQEQKEYLRIYRKTPAGIATAKRYQDKFKKDKARVAKKKELKKSWEERNPEYGKLLKRKERLKCIDFYSNGKNECACCHEKNIEFLSLDHTNGGGNKHRKEINRRNINGWLIKNKFPEGFRVLCHNCNQSLGCYGYCPHGNLIT